MDWTELLKSVVVATAVSGIVAAIGFFVSAKTALRINKDKLKLDKELADQKAASERDLAERRVDLDRKLAIAKRRAEVAEKVLSDFYRIKKAFDIIRSPMIWANEMIPEEGIEEDIINNDGYGVMRRTRQYADQFSELEATRYTFGALFGNASTAPFDEIVRAHNRVFHAAESLLRYRKQLDNAALGNHIQKMRREAFSLTALDDQGREVPDLIAETVIKAVNDIEASCRPALESDLAVLAAG